MAPWEPVPPPRPRRSVGAGVVGLGVVVALLLAAALYSPGNEWQLLRRMAGMEQRLAEAPPADARGPHAFVLTQRDSDEPVGYDPCRPIRYRINPAQAPEDYRTYVDTAVARVSAATGLVFEYDGTTGSRNFFTRPTGARSPVVVAWATEDEVPELAGDVAGVAGSIAVDSSFGRREYVTGAVVLDADAFAAPRFGPSLQPVVDHEFAHLVGLAHVDDPSQLMHPSTARTSRFAGGDLEGLRRLGSIPCG